MTTAEGARTNLRQALHEWQHDHSDKGAMLAKAAADYLAATDVQISVRPPDIVAPEPDDELWQPLTLQRDGDWLRMVPGCPLAPCRWGAHATNMRPDAVLDRATDALALILGLVEHLQEDHQALLPGRDEPTKTPQAVAPYFDLTTVINYVTQMDESGVPVPDSVLAAVERMRSAP